MSKKTAIRFLTIIVVIISSYSYSQQQVNLDVDNDLYFDRDFYYSSGIFLSYSSYKIEEKKIMVGTSQILDFHIIKVKNV